MDTIKASTRRYETWLRAQLGDDFVEADLERKHRRMRQGAFPFLRATYWRWSEVILHVCPSLKDAAPVLAIGDTHLENFGTWRDSDGRLIWGLNDFDEAATMPYALDLVRLAASAILAGAAHGPGASEIAEDILEGYGKGLRAPKPFVLERENRWLREMVMLPERERSDFWRKIDELEKVDPPRRFKVALHGALPATDIATTLAKRTAGTGSLGRPRFVAHGLWRGGPIVREAKALVQSAWSLEHKGDAVIRTGIMASGRCRAPDPHYQVAGGLVVRRLSLNSRKIEVEDDPHDLLSPRMLSAMGFEVANCHGDDDERRHAIIADLHKRPEHWLKEAALAAARNVSEEQKAFAA